MRRDTDALTGRTFDVVVVGGGIFGASIARDAAMRGLDTALLERDDFCAATSAHSFRMIHGGIRYLQHADLPRIRESARERAALLRIAPHLAEPLPIVVPTHRDLRGSRALLRAGLLAYDLATWDRNRGIADPARRIPAGRLIGRDEVLRRFPGLPAERLTGAGLFHDGQMYNPTRLAFAVVRSAVDAGAVAVNRVEVTGLLLDGRRVRGVRAEDRENGSMLEVRARHVVNAAGPWAARLLETQDPRLAPALQFSRDTAFVVDRPPPDVAALAVQGATRDPDAWLSRGQRHLFLVPWRERYTLVGVWHVVHRGDPDRIPVTEEETRRYLDEINAAYPALALRIEDVTAVNAGLVLFGDNEQGATDLSYGKRSSLIDHARTHDVRGLWTVIGVRWTTARGVAERVVDRLFRARNDRPPPSRTATEPLPGGAIGDIASFLAEAEAAAPATIDRVTIRALARNHGSRYPEILAYGEAEPALLRPLPGSSVLGAEVVHAVREEMALGLQDIALRRTDLASAGDPGEPALTACAGLAARELGWDDARTRTEVDALRAGFPGWRRAS